MKIIHLLRVQVLLVLLLLGSCRNRSVLHNRIKQPLWTLDRLYFGRSIPTGAQVSEHAWRGFLADVVTPRFPHGLTVWQAEGQWRDPTGAIVRESTFLLELAHPTGSESRSKLNEIIEAYKRQFRQGSVLRITDQVRVEF